MSKYYLVGGILCICGLVLVGFQAISSMMTPGEIVWKSLSLVDVVNPAYLKWVQSISWNGLQKIVHYIITMPLYLLLLATGIFSFIVGGLVDK
jgi:hypothetical protein